MTYRLFGLFLLFFSPVTVLAGEVIFEGYSKVLLSGKNVGYTIQRFEYDPKTQNFTSIAFMRLKIGDTIAQESLKAVSNNKLQPISYNFTGQTGDKLKSIDATFKGDVMSLKISDTKTLRNETHKIPKATFLSSFLLYVLLQKKMIAGDGEESAFKFSAVAEEDGNSYNGKAWLKTREEKSGLQIFRILNQFKGDEFVSRVAAVPDPAEKDKYVKAEVIGSVANKNGISTELVSEPIQATEGHVVPNKTLITLFGNMPTGKLNLIANPPPKPAK